MTYTCNYYVWQYYPHHQCTIYRNQSDRPMSQQIKSIWNQIRRTKNGLANSRIIAVGANLKRTGRLKANTTIHQFVKKLYKNNHLSVCVCEIERRWLSIPAALRFQSSGLFPFIAVTVKDSWETNGLVGRRQNVIECQLAMCGDWEIAPRTAME